MLGFIDVGSEVGEEFRNQGLGLDSLGVLVATVHRERVLEELKDSRVIMAKG